MARSTMACSTALSVRRSATRPSTPTSGAGRAASSSAEPSTPSGLAALAASSTQIDLGWTASTDDVGVAGYDVFRNGARIATTTNTFYSDTGLSPATSYSYSELAF